MRLYSFQISVFLLALACFAYGASPYKKMIRIYDFSPTADYSSVFYTDVEVIDRVGGETTFASRSTRYFFTPSITSPTETVPNLRQTTPPLLTPLQRRALEKMRDDGYIPQEIFDAVIEDATIWHPKQLRYAVLWSEVTVGEAKSLFGGAIPKDRVLTGVPGHSVVDVSRMSDSQKIGITRSSLMAAVGQSINESTGELDFWQLSWERDKRFAGVAPLDRNLFPGALEVSRLHCESGPVDLQGDLKVTVRALLSVLSREAHHQNIPLDRYVTFGWTRSRRLAAFDYKVFGIRPMSPEVVEWFQSNYYDAARGYHNIPLPEKDLEHYLLFGLLDDVVTKFGAHGVSERDRKLVEASRGQISHQQARGLFEKVVGQYLQFMIPPPCMPGIAKPVCIENMSPFRNVRVANELAGIGITDNEVGNGVFRTLSNATELTHPNVFTDRWLERGYIIPSDPPPGATTYSPFIMIQNLDPKWLKTYGELGARALLLSVMEIQKAEMFPQDDLQRNNLFGAVAQVFGAEAPSSEYLVGAYLHHKSWVVVVTTYPEVRDVMVRLGGMVRGAQVLDRGEVELDWVGGKAGDVNEIGFEASLDFMGSHMQFGAGDPSKPRLRMRTKTGNFQPYAIWFKTAQIERLESSDRFQCSQAILRGLWRQLSSEM